MEILTPAGKVLRSAQIAAHQGVNGINWDLRLDPPTLVELRTTPPENPHIWEEPRFEGQQTRAITHWGLAQAEVGPIAAPGDYTVRMTVDGQTQSQPFKIMRTPDSHGTDADLQSSVRWQLKVRDDINAVSDMTNQIEWMRKQLEDQHKSAADKAQLVAAMDAIDRKLQDVEYKMITRADALSDDKYFQSAYKLYQNFIWLNGEIGTGAGDVQGSGDWGLTETAIGLVVGLEKELATVQAEYKGLMEKEVPAYNQKLSGSGVEPLKTTGAPPPPARTGGRFGG